MLYVVTVLYPPSRTLKLWVVPDGSHVLQMKMCIPTPTHPGVELRGCAPPQSSCGQGTTHVSEMSPSPARGLLHPLGRGNGPGGAGGRLPAWQNVCPVASLQT